MITDIKINRPEPIDIQGETELFKHGEDIQLSIEELEAGRPVVLTEYYNNGLSLIRELQAQLKTKLPNKSIEEQKEYRIAYNKLSNLILVEVENYRLVLRNAPKISWLRDFYPEQSNLFLSFPQVQDLNDSWNLHQKGVSIPVLRNKIKPYYGTSFPTHFEHLILFDNWLKRYSGAKKSAINVRIESGIFSLQLAKHGFQKVFGTDDNPNAVVGLAEFMGSTKLSRKIELDFGPLFGKWEKQTELIVFNPPLLPKPANFDELEEANYYDESLFPEFFEGAKQRLLPEGKLVLIFSNDGQLVDASNEHPIKKELADGGRFQMEKCLNKPVKNSSKEVEIWILTHK